MPEVAEGPGLRPARPRQEAARPKRRRGLQGERSKRREPHRVQFPRRLWWRRQRDLVQRWRRQRQGRHGPVPRRLPVGDDHLLQGGRTRGRLRHLLEQLARARHLHPQLREQHGRLEFLRRRLPARLQPGRRPRPRAGEHARALEHERRRPARGPELRVGPQQDRDGHEQPEQRRRARASGWSLPSGSRAAERRRPGAGRERVLHGLARQLRPRQQHARRAGIGHGG